MSRFCHSRALYNYRSILPLQQTKTDMATNDKSSQDSEGSHESDNMKNLRGKNFGLTEKEFNELVIELQNGDDTLIEKAYLANAGQTINYLIREYGAIYDDAYNATTDALLGIRKDLIRGGILKYDNLAYVFTLRARRLLNKRKNNDNKASFINLEEDIKLRENNDFVKKIQTTEIANIVSKALTSLCEECQLLLKLRFYEGLTWSKIAQRLEPEKEGKDIEKSSDKFKKRVSRTCLPKFKKLLEKLL